MTVLERLKEIVKRLEKLERGKYEAAQEVFDAIDVIDQYLSKVEVT